MEVGVVRKLQVTLSLFRGESFKGIGDGAKDCD